MYWKSPRDGHCCECRPSVCDPCDSCPTAATVTLALSGLIACCTPDGARLTGLGAVNGTHTLTRDESGNYTTTLSHAVALQWFADSDCATLFSTDETMDVTITFSCSADGARLDVQLTDSGVHLFYAEIMPPESGSLFVFAGAEECSAFTPYTYGGSATVSS